MVSANLAAFCTSAGFPDLFCFPCSSRSRNFELQPFWNLSYHSCNSAAIPHLGWVHIGLGLKLLHLMWHSAPQLSFRTSSDFPGPLVAYCTSAVSAPQPSFLCLCCYSTHCRMVQGLPIQVLHLLLNSVPHGFCKSCGILYLSWVSGPLLLSLLLSLAEF